MVVVDCIDGCTVQTETVLRIVALLGKSATDDTPMSLTSLLHAVHVKIKKPAIAEFDRAHAT